MTVKIVRAARSTTSAGTSPRRFRMDAAVVAAAVGLAIFLDAAIETFLAGSLVRWWVVGAAALYILATAATCRSRIGWRGRVAIGSIGMMALVAVTAWGPAGLSDGIRIAGQPTTRVLAVLAGIGVTLAGLVLIRLELAPLAVRVAVGAIAAYGAAAFALGAVSLKPVGILLAGQSLWQRLPMFFRARLLAASSFCRWGWSLRPRAPAYDVVRGRRCVRNCGRLPRSWRAWRSFSPACRGDRILWLATTRTSCDH